MWFRSLDKLIDYINSKEDKYHMRVFYSTPTCYTMAVNEAFLFFVFVLCLIEIAIGGSPLGAEER
jgi:hypothetical protein